MAATAYESVVSLMHTIDHVMEHGRTSFALNYEQIQSVYQKAEFLVDFLESYSHGDNTEVEALEIQIADSAHAAEDLIEFKVVDYIRDSQSNPFCQQLQDAIGAMDLVKNKAMEIINKGKGELKVQLPKDSVPPSSSSSLHVGKEIMVGFDDVLNQIMDRLTRQESNRLNIAISGMGGIGKTTLAKNVYENPYIVKHFDIRAWVTISQNYEIEELFSSLFKEFGVNRQAGMNERQLGEKVHKHLFGRKYLIVFDDMWGIDVWEKLQPFFPDNENGSRILITTRLTNMARDLGSHGIEVDFLDDDQSWNLLREKVFGQQECPLELEEIGKKIARNCKGLPLSIVVIAGLLSKSSMTQEYWYRVAEDVISIVNQADDGHCSKILSLSYANLPVHLKPCFLYLGVFREDRVIYVSRLIHLWIAEGFLKPSRTKSLEEVAEEYLMDLIDRNIIMVFDNGLLGNVKYCEMHDLLRDLCIREAEKEKFFCVAESLNSSQALRNQRRIVIDRIETEQDVPASPLLRSITCNTDLDLSFLGGRLIRVLNAWSSHGSLENVVNLVNLRYLRFGKYGDDAFDFRSMTSPLWNMQNLIILVSAKEPFEIWEMKHLRYLRFSNDHFFLSEPSPLMATNVLHNLQTLKSIYNLNLSEEVVKRIPNVRKLKLRYNEPTDLDREKLGNCLSNLQDLRKLEILKMTFRTGKPTFLGKSIMYPHSLKELKLSGTYIPWEDMTRIGCLPNLQVLRLFDDAFVGEEWNPIEGQFISLKYLKIDDCDDLQVWNAESSHFPVLETLAISSMESLKEVPLSIGEIPTLRSIELYDCSDSVVRSVNDILDEQESLGNDDIKYVKLVQKKIQFQNHEVWTITGEEEE